MNDSFSKIVPFPHKTECKIRAVTYVVSIHFYDEADCLKDKIENLLRMAVENRNRSTPLQSNGRLM